MKKCPFCAEAIQDDAIKCRYCGSMLTGAATPGPSQGSDSALDAEVRHLLSGREKIAAIKLVRQRKGLGLAEAKAYVEAVENGTDPTVAPQVSARGTPRGCLPVIVLLILAAAIIVTLMLPALDTRIPNPRAMRPSDRPARRDGPGCSRRRASQRRRRR